MRTSQLPRLVCTARVLGPTYFTPPATCLTSRLTPCSRGYRCRIPWPLRSCAATTPARTNRSTLPPQRGGARLQAEVPNLLAGTRPACRHESPPKRWHASVNPPPPRPMRFVVDNGLEVRESLTVFQGPR